MYDKAERCLIAVMRRLMQRTKHFVAKKCVDDNTHLNNALVKMRQKRVFDDKLILHLGKRF